MSEAEAAPEQDNQKSSESGSEGSEQSEIANDEFANVDMDALAESVELETGANSDLDPEPAEESDVSATEEPLPEPEGDTWGDMYVGTLTTFSNALIEEHGKEGVELVGESLPRQLHLDEYMDDWLASQGKREDMPPEQALLVSTAIFMVTVIGAKTDLPAKALSEANL